MGNKIVSFFEPFAVPLFMITLVTCMVVGAVKEASYNLGPLGYAEAYDRQVTTDRIDYFKRTDFEYKQEIKEANKNHAILVDVILLYALPGIGGLVLFIGVMLLTYWLYGLIDITLIRRRGLAEVEVQLALIARIQSDSRGRFPIIIHNGTVTNPNTMKAIQSGEASDISEQVALADQSTQMALATSDPETVITKVKRIYPRR